MELEEFYESVERCLGEGVDVDADEAARAVLAALATRLDHDDAVELGAQLPDALGDVLATAAGGQRFDRDELIEDVAARLDLDDVDAERVALAVLGAVRAALETQVAVEQVIEALPAELAKLIHAAE